jgi:hypothetical protein
MLVILFGIQILDFVFHVTTIIDRYDRKETLPLKESKESKEKDLAQLFLLCIELYGKHMNRRYIRDV